ncbi:MAG: ATP-binding cassette domain-containing protein, partial [Paramuribaculum sp.]|nr:ATP-binding cassette domain-containing protein [Paramuribaculum sp.]
MDSLSDGERQKTMIAKALAQSTPIIILDEPSAFLDYPSKADLMSLLASLARAKNKVIFQSTHDLDIALQISDKVWMLDRDKGFTIGTPSALGDSGALNRYFDRSTLTYNPSSERFIVKT